MGPKGTRGRAHEKLCPDRVRSAAANRRGADAGAARHRGAVEDSGIRGVPQRFAHLGRLFRSRRRQEAVVAKFAASFRRSPWATRSSARWRRLGPEAERRQAGTSVTWRYPWIGCGECADAGRAARISAPPANAPSASAARRLCRYVLVPHPRYLAPTGQAFARPGRALCLLRPHRLRRAEARRRGGLHGPSRSSSSAPAASGSPASSC